MQKTNEYKKVNDKTYIQQNHIYLPRQRNNVGGILNTISGMLPLATKITAGLLGTAVVANKLLESNSAQALITHDKDITHEDRIICIQNELINEASSIFGKDHLAPNHIFLNDEFNYFALTLTEEHDTLWVFNRDNKNYLFESLDCVDAALNKMNKDYKRELLFVIAAHYFPDKDEHLYFYDRAIDKPVLIYEAISEKDDVVTFKKVKL